MNEPEIGLAFSPDPWVEALHRHCSDHGGARVRALIVDAVVALAESYDVFVAGHRWPALTFAFVDEVHARGCPVLGVYDREEPAGRDHLLSLGVDAVVASDAGEESIIRAVADLVGIRLRTETAPDAGPVAAAAARSVVIGGPQGTGRTEVAIALAWALARRRASFLVDADDVGPGVAPRLGLEPTPNLCDAIDAVEHGRGELDRCVHPGGRRGPGVVAGLGHPEGWSRIRPGEVARVIARLGADGATVVVDGATPLDDVPTTSGRSRHATARALVVDATVGVATMDPTPAGIVRALDWLARARVLAPDLPVVIAVNRAPSDRFRRREIAAAIADVAPRVPLAWIPPDPRVPEAAWAGRPVGSGPFGRGIDGLAELVSAALDAVGAPEVAA